MAYDPALTSFLLVGIVGGVAVILGITADWEVTDQLARATDRWTAPWVVRRYATDARDRKRRSTESAILRAHGYAAVFERSEDGGPAAPAGRTMAGAAAVSAASEVGSHRQVIVTFQLA